MKTEELKTLGLTDEQISAVMKQNGQDVENIKSRYADYDNVKKQLVEAGKTIEELKGKAGDIETIQKMADDWKAKAEQADKDAKARMDAMRLDFAVERELGKAGARNPTFVRKLLDVEKLKMEDGGPNGAEEIGGLKEQLEKLRESDGYLFHDAKPVPRFSKSMESQSEPDTDAAVRAVMGLPADNK